MGLAQKTQPDRRQQRKSIRFSLPIGLRLSLAFMTIILFTGLIGILSIQQISSLTNKAAELNARDLPESITLEQLRSLLYRQDDLEHSLINGDNVFPAQPSPSVQQGTPTTQNVRQDSATIALVLKAGSTPTPHPGTTPDKQTQELSSELASVLKGIQGDCQQLLTFERTEYGEDLMLVQRVTDAAHKASALSLRIQTLVMHEHFAQARTLDFTQQEPLLLLAITTVTRLSSLEQTENANDTTQMQQDSGRSVIFVLALTAFCLLLSIALATIITRSLTRPLKALLNTTEAITVGNLNVDPKVERTDEIGRLASAYDNMRLSLRSTIARLRQERQQTQAIIDATADGIILVDGEQKIVQWNPAAEHLTGWQANEANGHYCWEVLGFKETSVQAAEANEQLFPLMEALQTKSEQSYLEMPIIARNGKPRWLAINCAPMPLDEGETKQHMVIGLHDISQLKAVEQMKSDFVAMVSHELRAPLTTVTSSVEMLSLLDPADTEPYHEVMSILDQQTRRLRQVVEEVLQLTRFDAGHLEAHVQPLSITRFLRSLADKTNAEWSNSDHCIILHASPREIQVWADGGLLEIVLRNLFDNARKYTPQGTAVEVATEVIASTSQVEIRVIDHGPGIPEDQLEHIFERFSRGTQLPATWTRGYGLGLYIARELMLAQNGAIRAARREQGACFVLSLWMVTDDPFPITMEVEADKVDEQGKEHIG